MVKRRDKTGRRQILQLEDKKPPPVNKVPKKGIIHYSDSEDERTQPRPEPSVGSSSEKNSNVDTAPIDSQLADFMKEIDALQSEEQHESSEAEPNQCVASSSNSDAVKSSCSEENGVLPSAQTESKEQVPESNTTDDPVASTNVDAGMYCLWQECKDDSTGYSYYWNMQTNEVTWECPPEYLAYLQYLNSTMEPTTSQSLPSRASSSKGSSRPAKKSKSKKDSVSGLEGKIIPISYFGGSSSSEDSTDDSTEGSSSTVVSSRSKLKKKSENSVSQSGRSKLYNKDQPKKSSKEATVSKAESIGPQLPPDFQFSQDVPVAPTTSVINSSLDGIPYVENEEDVSPMIGPQLPSYYIPRENKAKEPSPPPADQAISSQEDNQLTKVSTSDEVATNDTSEQDPPQSTVDGSVSHASSDGETWEESLLKIEEQFKNFDRTKKDVEEEQPDSTTKKESAQPVQTVNSSRTNDKILALKPVVEYSSCTDDDDDGELDTSSAGPSHRNSSRETNSNLIDNMFSFAHSSDKKFGFGFSKCQQLEIENDIFDAGSNDNRGKRPKRKAKGSYSKISFVKSKEVLDLTTLNSCSAPEQEVSSVEEKVSLVESENLPDVNPQNVSPQNENSPPTVDDVDCDEIDQALENALTEKVVESVPVVEKVMEPSTSEIIVEPSTSGIQLKKGKKHSADTDIKPDTLVKKFKQEEPVPSVEISANLTTSILDLSNILVDKLSFLVSSQSTMSSLTSLLIQIQTRLIDWQSGALDSKYFMDRLQEVDQYLHHYEMSTVAGDWMCQWDSEHKRYFYVNRRTQQSQWTFPTECSIQVAMQSKQLWENHISDIAASSTSSYQAAGGQFPLVSSSMSDERSRNGTPSAGIFMVKEEEPEHEMLELYPTPSASWVCPAPRPQPSPPPPPPGVDSPPPPPPPITPPPASPPPPPPDSTELEEGEIPDVDMDVEDSNSSGSVTYSGKASQSDDPLPVPSNILESCSSTGSPDHHPRISTSIVSSTSAMNSEQLAVIVKPPQPVVSSSSGFVNVSVASSLPSTWTHSVPSCSSTQNAYHPIPMVADEASVVPSGASVPPLDSVTINEVSETSTVDNSISMPTPSVASVSNTHNPLSMPSTSASTSSASSGTPRKEKKKSKLLPGLALKRKNIPNLVEKWVKIKKQQEKENKSADEARISTSM